MSGAIISIPLDRNTRPPTWRHRRAGMVIHSGMYRPRNSGHTSCTARRVGHSYKPQLRPPRESWHPTATRSFVHRYRTVRLLRQRRRAPRVRGARRVAAEESVGPDHDFSRVALCRSGFAIGREFVRCLNRASRPSASGDGCCGGRVWSPEHRAALCGSGEPRVWLTRGVEWFEPLRRRYTGRGEGDRKR